ncbi:uncharacterized protein [Procambarus clarkii]|uniref:uncharacterized protein n=1 Tax=Procambarus clarkii TaxID=6728 RepID=UPI003743B9AB
MSVCVVAVVAVVAVVCGTSATERDGRFFFINPGKPTAVTFLLNVPLSLVLPTLAPVNGRSLDAEGRDETPEDLAWDQAYEYSLKRLLVYFQHLELTTMACQERLICEITADPDGFSPITQIFTKELRLEHGPVERTEDSLMWRYLTAAREGFTEPIERCAVAYPTCPLSAHSILDTSVLKVWQFLASKLNLRLK